MAQDYYKTLGVPRDASATDIQKAYRALARKHHPDMNPDDKSATKKFQEIQAAFDVLNNPEKREMYDRYGSSFETMGAGGPRPGAGPGGADFGGFPGGPGGGSFEDVDFAQFFGDRFDQQAPGGWAEVFSQFRRAGGAGGAGGPRRGGGAAGRRRGQDVLHELEIPFHTAVAGGTIDIAVNRPDKPETLQVKIPAGIEDGKKIRLRGKGGPAPARGTPGDIIITIHVAAHPWFERHGNDLHVKLPVTLGEAALGAKVDVPTPTGTVSLKIPPATSSGKKLRVKGRGVAPRNGPAGDLLAEVRIVLPKSLSEADQQAIRDVDSRNPLDPRANLQW
jgi:DnaJ-class molecular chaperone